MLTMLWQEHSLHGDQIDVVLANFRLGLAEGLRVLSAKPVCPDGASRAGCLGIRNSHTHTPLSILQCEALGHADAAELPHPGARPH